MRFVHFIPISDEKKEEKDDSCEMTHTYLGDGFLDRKKNHNIQYSKHLKMFIVQFFGQFPELKCLSRAASTHYCHTNKYNKTESHSSQVWMSLVVSLIITITFNHLILCSHLKMLCIECIESELQMKTIVMKCRWCCFFIAFLTCAFFLLLTNSCLIEESYTRLFVDLWE